MSNVEERKIAFVTFLTPESLKKLETIAQRREKKISMLIREAVENWLSEPEQEVVV